MNSVLPLAEIMHLGRILSSTFYYSLWQAALIYIILQVIFLFFNPTYKIQSRLMSQGMIMLLLWNGFSFLHFFYSDTINFWIPLLSNDANIIIGSAYTWIAVIWLLGICFSGISVCLGLYKLHKYRTTGIVEHPQNWNPVIQNVKHKMGMKEQIWVSGSSLVPSIFVSGIYKHVVLFPKYLMLRINTIELELILAHEFGHIKQKDFLYSLVQRIISSIYVFNPVVWLMISDNHKIRELAADSSALSVTTDRLGYSKMLIKLHELNLGIVNFGASIINSSSLLKNRIFFILDKPLVGLAKLKLFNIAFCLLILGLGLGYKSHVVNHPFYELQNVSKLYLKKQERHPKYYIPHDLLNADQINQLIQNKTFKLGNDGYILPFNQVNTKIVLGNV